MQSPPGWGGQQAQTLESPSEQAGARRDDVSVIDAIKFPFQGEHWLSNLFLAFVFQLIPVLGQIALLGWHAEIMHRLRSGDPRPAPKLEFGDMMHYFSRGVPSFLGGIVVGMPFGFLIGVVVGLGGFIAGIVAGAMRIRGPEVVLVVYGLAGVVMLIASPLMMIAGNAVTTRAELTEDGGKALEFGKLWSYASRTWGIVLIAWFGFVCMSMLIALAGLLVCFFGVYLAAVAISIARVHLRWQIYEVYLSRGGEPIPLKFPRDPVPSEAARRA
ncbi:MAG: DUF4013 domain-containing protein [Polyangiaceae bacterium]|nr:DUF4013 domain-containing protein [Polyangiaceae bacterium]